MYIENINNLADIRNMGAKSITEIEELMQRIDENGLPQVDTQSSKEDVAVPTNIGCSALPENILNRPATDFDVSVRICNSFAAENIKTIGQVVALNPTEIRHLKNMGSLSQQQLMEQIKLLYELGEDYFKQSVVYSSGEVVSNEYQSTGKGFDFPMIDILTDRFFFKPVRMTDWFGLSRQGIYNAIDKRSPKRHEAWTGKKLTDNEREILSNLVQDRIFDYCDEIVICCCMNDRQGDLVCIFIYEDEIECHFLADLPEDLQQQITDNNYHKYTERELSGEADGDVVYCIRKPYFMPKYPYKFRTNAQLRGITYDEYAVFLSGYPMGDRRLLTETYDKKEIIFCEIMSVV